MSILDTFTILFNSNADQVKKGEEEATAAGKKLAVELDATGEKGAAAAHHIEEANRGLAESFDVIKEHASEMASRLIEHALEVAAAFQALFAVEKLVDNFFETSEASDQLGERAKSLGVNIEQLDAWGNATKRVGGTAEGFGESLVQLNRQMDRLEATGKSRILPFFKQLGVDAIDPVTKKVKGLFDLLPELAKATEGKSKQETSGALRGLGLDEGTIRLLQRGSKEIDELIARQKRLGLVTAEDAETAEKFNIEWDDIKQIFHSITVEADTYFLPMLQTILEYIEETVEFLRDHKDLVVGFFIALGTAAIWAADAFGLLDFALAVLFSPITLLVAAIGAVIGIFALFYEDIMVFSRGGHSALGELAKRFPIVGIAINAVIATIKELKEIASEVFEAIEEWVNRLPEGFRQWEHIISEATENWLPEALKAMGGIGKAIARKLEEVEKEFHKRFGSAIPAIFTAFLDTVKAILHLFSDLFVDPINAINNFDKAIEKVLEHLEKRFPIVKRIADDLKLIGDDLNWLGRATGALAPAKPESKEDRQAERDIERTNERQQRTRDRQTAAGWQNWAAGGPVPLTPGATAVPALPDAQAALAATQVPIMAQSPAGLAAAGGVVNHFAVTIGPTTVNVPSGQPEAIAAAIDDHMKNHISTAINQTMADGVSH